MMRLRLIFAACLVCVATSLAATAGAQGATRATCDGCGGGFAGLSGDIQTIVPAPYQRAFLFGVTLAQNFLLPPNPIHPPSPCLAARTLDLIGYGAQALGHRGVITQGGTDTLVADVTQLNNGIIATYPPSPCLSSIHFRTPVSST